LRIHDNNPPKILIFPSQEPTWADTIKKRIYYKSIL
jgi:hypothetical protein